MKKIEVSHINISITDIESIELDFINDFQSSILERENNSEVSIFQ